jgi:hypothetical protein
MKTKQFYILVITVVFVSAMIIYHKQMTFMEIVFAFTSSGGLIGWIYQWLLTDNQKVEKLLFRDLYKNELNRNIEILNNWELQQKKLQEKTSQDT